MGTQCTCYRKKMEADKAEEILGQGLKGLQSNTKENAAKKILRAYKSYKLRLKKGKKNLNEINQFLEMVKGFSSNLDIVNVILNRK